MDTRCLFLRDLEIPDKKVCMALEGHRKGSADPWPALRWPPEEDDEGHRAVKHSKQQGYPSPDTSSHLLVKIDFEWV